MLVALVALVVVRVAARARRAASARRRVRSTTGDFDTARDRAERARLLNPLSVEPIWALARVDERQGRDADAEERYVQAVELQPENPETWYALGLYEFQVRGNMCAAYEFLNNAYTLDPAGSQWVEGGELDIAREAVNKGACEPLGHVAGRGSERGARVARDASTAASVPGGASSAGRSSQANQPTSLTSAGSGAPTVPSATGEVVRRR